MKKQSASECKLQGHKGGWDENGTAYCTTCNEQSTPIETAWANLKAPINETVTSKWYFKKGYEAALLAVFSENTKQDKSEKCHCGKNAIVKTTHGSGDVTFECDTHNVYNQAEREYI